jgi:phosphatidylserine decarboxylase
MKKFFLSIIALPFFSRIWGWLVRRKHPRFIVKKAIKVFINKYKIDMDEYEGKPEDYSCLSDFFIRKLDEKNRPLIGDPASIVSPADGVLSGLQTIYTDKVTQVKGKTYSMSELLDEDLDFSIGWHVATIYLSPYNYHRFHYPLTGIINKAVIKGGRLFPVNPMGLNSIDRLFVKNERVITKIEKNNQPCYMVAIGATFVGSIAMEFISNPRQRKEMENLHLEVVQLAEMGRFEMGSTIILAMASQMVDPRPEIIEGRPIQVGEPIFTFKAK